MGDGEWLDTIEFAKIAEIKRQVANRICLGFVRDKKKAWRGHALEVRTVHGKGGKSGIQYQVKVSSLPPEIQARLNNLQTNDESADSVRVGRGAQFERNWKYDVIRPALEHPKHSAQRVAIVSALIGTSRLDWKGKPRQLSKACLYRWIKEYEKGDIHALSSKVRSDKGNKRCHISRAWTKAVPFDATTRSTIEEDLKQFIRSLVKGGTTRKNIRELAGDKLKKLTALHGFRSNDADLEERIFKIPHQLVQAEMHLRAVYRHKHDRQASEDNKPRVKRTIEGMQPMELVVMDVHHINVRVLRENGTAATPKLLAFHDVATNRVFVEIIFFEASGAVRNSDLITAFVRMCQHPSFGIPQTLYADNGSEYGFADDLEDALKLGAKVIAKERAGEHRAVIRALPYNAAAKQVEGWFRQMNQQYFRHIKGWIDDDRMKPKRPALGKMHKPYDEGFDAFVKTVREYIHVYENMPQEGALKGRSPAQVFAEHVESGWSATVINPMDLLTVFTRQETRVVKSHGIDIKKRPWVCDELLRYHGNKVVAHIPKYHGFGAVLITDGRGNRIGIARADDEYHPTDERGAKESARRVKEWRDGLRELDESVPDVDVGAELIGYGKSIPPVVPNKPDGVLSVSDPQSAEQAIVPESRKPKTRDEQAEEVRQIYAEHRALLEAASKRKSKAG